VKINKTLPLTMQRTKRPMRIKIQTKVPMGNLNLKKLRNK